VNDPKATSKLEHHLSPDAGKGRQQRDDHGLARMFRSVIRQKGPVLRQIQIELLDLQRGRALGKDAAFLRPASEFLYFRSRPHSRPRSASRAQFECRG